MAQLTLFIEGMSCGHCLNAVSKALGVMPGVTIRSVTIGRAEVDYDPGLADPAGIAAGIAEAGYRATPAPA